MNDLFPDSHTNKLNHESYDELDEFYKKQHFQCERAN